MRLLSGLPLVGLSVVFLFSACTNKSLHEQKVEELLKIDREFSDLSINVGSHKAFLTYIDDSCALLRPNRLPVIGRQKIEQMFSNPDTSVTLRWEPIKGDVSASGDLGYTFGIYTIEMDSPEGQVVTKEGTYVTIWKKDKNGDWKFVLDTGNQGLGAKNGDNGN